jgi:prepilin-type N-terminal cleavage/methylation domain-containing protein
MRQRARSGFTLLEVLVATTVMALAVGTLLTALSTSLGNARRTLDSDRVAMLAKRTMDELIAAPLLPRGQILEGKFNPTELGVNGGWRAQVSLFDPVPGRSPRPGDGIDRIVLELWWMSGPERRTFHLEGYRRASFPEGPAW